MPSGLDSQLRRDYFWNTLASVMVAASTVIIGLVVTRAAGLEAGGLVAFAITAVGQQLQMVGVYEVRPYQTTDVSHRFEFGTYHATRVITVLLMVVGIVGYTLLQGRPMSEALAIMLIASFRLFDAYEDVFLGEFQRSGRLDVAGKANFFRALTTTLVFCVVFVFTKNLLVSAAWTILLSLIVMLLLILPPARAMFQVRPIFNWSQIRSLLTVCFPLFLGAFLSMYLANAPRYSIDRYLTDYELGVFAILVMPAVTINLLSLVLFRPLLTRMANLWAEGDGSGFRRLVVRGLVSVAAASALVFVVTYFIGVPLLGLLYGTDLSAYKLELMVLVVSGAFNATSVVLYYALTTVRKQNLVFIGYLFASVSVFILSSMLVQSMELLGAAIAYGSAMLVLNGMFAGALLLSSSKSVKSK